LRIVAIVEINFYIRGTKQLKYTEMKRILLFLAFVLTCSVSYAQKTWKVGDFYDVNGKQGVVYIVTPDGMHGKIISLYQTYTTWEEAKKWCSNLGSGWRLPSKGELLHIYKVRNTLNQILPAVGDVIPSEYYWSSTEQNSEHAWLVDMYRGGTDIDNKDLDYDVRAVSAF
jgi:hypothetical protein